MSRLTGMETEVIASKFSPAALWHQGKYPSLFTPQTVNKKLPSKEGENGRAVAAKMSVHAPLDFLFLLSPMSPTQAQNACVVPSCATRNTQLSALANPGALSLLLPPLQ